MIGWRKIASWTAAALLALLVVLVAAAVVLAPRVVDSEAVKTRLTGLISRETGARVSVERMSLSWFPRPRITFRTVSVEVPGRAIGSLPSVDVEPGLLPLLLGRLRIDAVRAAGPSLKLALPPRRPGPAGEGPPTLEEVQNNIASLMRRLSAEFPGLAVAVDNGSLALSIGDGETFSFREIRVHAVLPPAKAKVELSCRSDLWDDMSANGILNPSDFTGAGQMAVAGLRTGPLAGFLFPDAPPPFSASPLTFRLDWRTEGIGTLAGNLAADVPAVKLRRGTGEGTVGALHLAGDFRQGGGKTSITVSEMRLGSPRLSLSGSLRLVPGDKEAGLDLSARDIDVAALREAALSLGEDIPLVRTLAGIVGGGRVPTLRLRSRGASVADLWKTQNLVLEGRLEEGKVSVPGPGLKISSVAGDAVFSRGILEGRGLAARWGNSSGSDGTLRLGLEGKEAPLELDIRVDSDLAELRAFLSRFVRNRAFRSELALVGKIEGRGQGRLILAGNVSKVMVRVEADSVRFQARYGRIPFPLRVEKGGFSYDGAGIGFRDVAGRIGESGISGLTGRLGLGKDLPVETLSGEFDLSLGQLFPWLASVEGLKQGLEAVSKADGAARVSVSHLQGPLRSPAKWRFKAAGELRNLAVVSSRLPGPVAVTEGRFGATHETLSLSGLLVSLLDADLQASGEIRGYLKGIPGAVDLTLNGVAGPLAVRAASDLLKVPGEIRLRSPLAVSRARMVRRRDGRTAVAGTLGFPDGPEVRFDVESGGSGTASGSLSVRDAESRADVKFDRRKNAVALAFGGGLAGNTVNRILAGRAILRGVIRGDFRAVVPSGHPERAAFEGTLEAEGIRLPPEWAGPLAIDALSLEGKGNAVAVRRGTLAWLDQPVSVSGSVRPGSGGARVDVDLAAGTVSVDRIREFFEARGRAAGEARESAGAAEASGPEASRRGAGLPLAGTVRIRAERLKWGGFEWRPVAADVTLGEGSVKAKVSRADLCGLVTSGTLSVRRGRGSLDLEIKSAGPDVNAPLACLTGNAYRSTGEYRFAAHLSGAGEGSDLFRALRGDFALTARNGRIYRFNVLGKILSVLNVTEIFRGTLPDLAAGLAYRSIDVKGTLAPADGKFRIEQEAAMDGESMGVVERGSVELPSRNADMEFLVSPFRTADAVVRHTPVVGYILGGRLVAVPAKVTGDLADPKVSVMSPSGVGSGLLGILERTLKTPIHLVGPLIPGSGNGGGTKKGP